MRKLSSLLLTAAMFTAVFAAPALADDWRWHGDGRHQFYEHDYDRWHGGNWFHGMHEGRDGWWWIVGGYWYYYPAPIYPYPDPYTPPTVVVETAPPAAIAAPPNYTYYCANPAGYYPYVTQCYGAWQRVESAPVPAQPPQIIVSSDSQRDLDNRQLDAYNAEFQNIPTASGHAGRALRDLAKRIEVFRQSLFHRNYNAMDMLSATEGLEHRVNERIERLSRKHATTAAPTAATVAQPPPSTPPQ